MNTKNVHKTVQMIAGMGDFFKKFTNRNFLVRLNLSTLEAKRSVFLLSYNFSPHK
jgi:hypothetical protein